MKKHYTCSEIFQCIFFWQSWYQFWTDFLLCDLFWQRHFNFEHYNNPHTPVCIHLNWSFFHLNTLLLFWTLSQSPHKCVFYFLAIRTSEHGIDFSCWFFWLRHSYLLGVECCITVAASLQAKEHIASDTPDTRLPSALLYSATHWVFQVDHVRKMSSRGNADWNRGKWSEATVLVWFVIFLLLLNFIAALLGQVCVSHFHAELKELHDSLFWYSALTLVFAIQKPAIG